MSLALSSILDLQDNGLDFRVRSYDPEMEGAVYPDGLPDRERDSVVKTLILNTDCGPACAILPYSHMLHMGRLRKLAKVKKVSLFPIEQLEPVIGYVIGAISPFGMKIRVPTFVEQGLQDFEYMYVNGGARGVQIVVPVLDSIQRYQWEVGSIGKVKD